MIVTHTCSNTQIIKQFGIVLTIGRKVVNMLINIARGGIEEVVFPLTTKNSCATLIEVVDILNLQIVQTLFLALCVVAYLVGYNTLRKYISHILITIAEGMTQEINLQRVIIVKLVLSACSPSLGFKTHIIIVTTLPAFLLTGAIGHFIVVTTLGIHQQLANGMQFETLTNQILMVAHNQRLETGYSFTFGLATCIFQVVMAPTIHLVVRE